VTRMSREDERTAFVNETFKLGRLPENLAVLLDA
jgi:hypothetical protein